MNDSNPPDRNRLQHRLRRHRTGLWNDQNFLRLWGGQSVSIFGSLVTRIALPFLAILELEAGSLQIALIHVCEILPAFLAGLVAGVWVDRLRRRNLMIAMDIVRAIALLLIPLAAWQDRLSLPLIYAVVMLLSVTGVVFEIAYQSYVPSLVGKSNVMEANAKMAGSSYVVETPAFTISGWLVQWLGAPIALLIDAFTFLWSAVLLRRIDFVEPEPVGATEREHVLQEAANGLRYVWRDVSLRAIAMSNTMFSFATSLTSAVFLLYLTREVGLNPGWQGTIFAIGGFGAVLGAVLTRRLSDRVGVGPLLIGCSLIVAFGLALPPLVREVTIIGVALLIGQQLIMDPFWGIYEIVGISARQAMTDEAWYGRTNATFRVLEFGAMLVGTLAGGWIGASVGLRQTLWVAVLFAALSALPMIFSPIRTLQSLPGMAETEFLDAQDIII